MFRPSTTFRYIGFLWLAALGISTVAKAQIEPDRAGPGLITQPITYEVISLFGTDTSKSIVNVHYRISQHYFIFIRNEAPSQGAEYIARGELTVELLNEQKISVAREIRPISLTSSLAVRESDPLPELQGAISLAVAPGSYTVVFSLDDRESGRTFLERNKRIVVSAPKLVPLEASQPILVQSQSEQVSWDSIVPVNRGGNIVLGERGGIIVQVFQPDTQQILSARWKLHGQLDGLGPRIQNLAGTELASHIGCLKLVAHSAQIQYKSEPSNTGWITCFIPIPFERLEPGSFVLDIEYSCGNVSQKQSKNFRVVWLNKPLSLGNSQLAIDALQHIATEEELSALQSGSATERAEAFNKFWRARDRDTTTAYNEVMAEYYYRVDEALRRFSTMREGDGYKTDRGRIYILYGPPPKTEKLLQPGDSPTEIWTYDRLNRRFVFIDPSKNGNYMLSQSEHL